MISRNLYVQIIIRVFLIASLALAAGSLIAVNASIIVVSICLILEVPVISNLISYLNTTNRKISYFLDSILNNDSAL